MDDEAIMRDLLAYTKQKFETRGILPFCAYVAHGGVVIAKGYYDGGDAYGAAINHGEMIAIKKASLSLRSYENLAGADLYTTCEPCLACLDTSLLVGIKRIMYAASHTDPETAVFFNMHDYYAEDYAKRHPDEISLVAFSHKHEALELFSLARQKYGF